MKMVARLLKELGYSLQFGDADANRPTRDRGGARDRGDAAVTIRPRLSGDEDPTGTLVQRLPHLRVALRDLRCRCLPHRESKTSRDQNADLFAGP